MRIDIPKDDVDPKPRIDGVKYVDSEHGSR
jgi:hypothetical protein